jgi:hypothetical protein
VSEAWTNGDKGAAQEVLRQFLMLTEYGKWKGFFVQKFMMKSPKYVNVVNFFVFNTL